MARATTTRDFAAFLSRFDTLPPEVTLGYITWYTVRDKMFPPDKVHQAYDDLGLDERFRPSRDIKAIDAWHKTMRDVGNAGQVRGRYDYQIKLEGRQVDASLALRKMKTDDARNEMWAIVRETSAKRYDALQLGVASFSKPVRRNGKVAPESARPHIAVPQALPEERAGVVDRMTQDIHSTYQQYLHNYDHPKIRFIMRDNILRWADGLMVKDSVYFVPAARRAELEALQGFADIFGPDHVNLSIWPIPDIPSVRHDLEPLLLEEADKIAARVAAQVAELGPNPSVRAFTTSKDAFDEAKGRIQRYSAYFQTGLDRSLAAMESTSIVMRNLERTILAELG